MFLTFCLNLALIIAAMVGVFLTGNPLFALILLMLQDLPYALAQLNMEIGAGLHDDAGGGDDLDEYPEQPMGFTAKLDKKK